jgi:hypothetical protein
MYGKMKENSIAGIMFSATVLIYFATAFCFSMAI